jgi:hypothetical protein
MIEKKLLIGWMEVDMEIEKYEDVELNNLTQSLESY